MFARLFAVAALAAFVAASPLVARGDQCNTGPIQCCNSVMSASKARNTVTDLSLISVLASAHGLVGLTCNPVLGANDCSQQPVCCKDNSYSGVIAIGCTPINVNA